MKAREGLGVEEECPIEFAVVREEYYQAMEHFWHRVQNCYFEFEDVVSETTIGRLFHTVLPDLTSQLIQGDGPYLRAVSELDLSYISDDLDFDFGFIGGAIVATGIVLSKPFVLAFF